ncbi:MAG: sulfite exporter TauE/SafE family protein [Acidimicrobiales bacterium]
MAVEVVLAIMIITGLAAFGQTVAGFGFSLLAVPPLGLVIDAKDAISVSVILLIVNSAMLAWGERQHVEWEAVRALLTGAAPGLPVGLAVIALTPVRGLRIALAIAVVLSVVFLVSGFETSRQSRRVELVGGFFCGLLTTSLNTNGPPAVLALQARRMAPEQFRPTTSAVLGLTSFVGALLFALAGRMNGEVGWACLVALPAMLVGWQVGLKARPRIPATLFRYFVLGLLVVAAGFTFIAAFS